MTHTARWSFLTRIRLLSRAFASESDTARENDAAQQTQGET
ncbi:hypothetical protein X907_0372 [Glycocaulis alkaliphilus]|uniref:Uncharacterized protein n=1 Tax=Glycocaulis alkaliphilus TaxID=1434191 RepID=A0A3T0E6N4_9PROT|nr:hypothetical protein X907_0372 [Glycocaulis alkaliphilus]